MRQAVSWSAQQAQSSLLTDLEAVMNGNQALTSEDISKIVDGFEPIDVEEMEMMAKMPPVKRWLVSYPKAEAIRADLRNKLRKDFPELSKSEINMKVLRSLTPVRMGKSYTEPAYLEHFG